MISFARITDGGKALPAFANNSQTTCAQLFAKPKSTAHQPFGKTAFPALIKIGWDWSVICSPLRAAILVSEI